MEEITEAVFCAIHFPRGRLYLLLALLPYLKLRQSPSPLLLTRVEHSALEARAALERTL